MNNNLENKILFEELKQQHINDGGKYPEAFAITELIENAIRNKTYKIYNGGGYEYNTENEIKNFDIVVWFNWGGDPYFQVCMDNSEGDSCVLVNSNNKGELIQMIK
jgi:hypothetical protein